MYNVAFVYTKLAGGYEGVVTWTTFDSKEDFQIWYTPELEARQRVVEEGISEERCLELTARTPFTCYVAAAVEEATDKRTGVINESVLEMRLVMALIASSIPPPTTSSHS